MRTPLLRQQIFCRNKLKRPGWPAKKQRGQWAPLLIDKAKALLVVDIHGDFKTKTNVTVFRCFPFHCHTLLHVFKKNIKNKYYLLLIYIVTSKPKRMSLYSGVSHFIVISSQVHLKKRSKYFCIVLICRMRAIIYSNLTN